MVILLCNCIDLFDGFYQSEKLRCCVMDMMDNSFQARYSRLPIATYAISELPHDGKAPFCLKHYH